MTQRFQFGYSLVTLDVEEEYTRPQNRQLMYSEKEYQEQYTQLTDEWYRYLLMTILSLLVSKNVLSQYSI